MNLLPHTDEAAIDPRAVAALGTTLDRLAADVLTARRELYAEAARRAVAEVRANDPDEHHTRLLRAAMLARLAPYVVQRAPSEFLPGMVGARLPVAAARVTAGGAPGGVAGAAAGEVATVAWVVVTAVDAARIAVEVVDGGRVARTAVDAAGLASLLGASNADALLAWVAICAQR